MAIDSAEKRRSAGGVAFHPLGPGITNNATHDAEWRFQSAWGYSGISVASPTTSTAAVAFEHFVYRGNRRMRAKKGD